jgi:hypothetical protein
MDEKTEALRDIFTDVADDDTVTDEQEEGRGSLSGERDPSERIGAVVERMRDRYEFDNPLSDAELVELVEGFYDGRSDDALAEALGRTRAAVVTARLELHLLRDADADAPFDLEALGESLAAGEELEEIATALDAEPATVRRYCRVLQARIQARRVSDRFRSEFEDALATASLGEQLTSDVQNDGLEDATAGMEVDVSF